ncbi:MAG TPA: hypothetical protein VHA75_10005 [Rugosimonospora sp.]|nr:hypothetical protein [Rugosimonospora sp.]
MTTFQQVLAVLGGLFTLAALLGVLLVYARGSADKATVEAQGNLLEVRKAEIDDLRRRMAVVEADNKHLHEENERLHEAVAQVKGIDKVQATVDAIHSDTKAIRAKVTAA